MRIAFEHRAIHERAGITFVGITNNILRIVRHLGHDFPLHAGGESCAAAATDAAGFDFRDYIYRLHLTQHLRQRPVTIPTDVFLDILRVN